MPMRSKINVEAAG